jgi:hypothetical protein
MVNLERVPFLRKEKAATAKQSHTKDEFLAKAMQSESAQSIDKIFADIERFPDIDKQNIEKLKEEMYEIIYDKMGGEIEPDDLKRVLVARNQKVGKKTGIFLTIITLGIFLCLRPRDDDMMLVLTKNGTIVKLKVERAPCCPRNSNQALFVFLRYIAILFFIILLPNCIYLLVAGKDLQEEYEILMEQEKKAEHYLKDHYIAVVLIAAVLIFWVWSLIPHDYRDRHRRRHTVHEVAVGQFSLTGSSCRRRCHFHLYFGKYPSQLMLDFAGAMGPVPAVQAIPPGDLSANAGIRPSTVIVGMTFFLSALTGVDTFFAWMDRGLAVEHAAKMQEYCIQHNQNKDECNQDDCENWAVREHVDLNIHFCKNINWVDSAKECTGYASKASPCCGGCTKGGFDGIYDEGTLATIKSIISLIADTGTIVFGLLAAKYALNLATATDNIDILIKRRSRQQSQAEISNFDLTMPIALNFMESVFACARTNSLHNRSSYRKKGESNRSSTNTVGTWCGTKNWTMDDDTKDWNDFFEKDLLALPDTRWTAKVKVPRHCLGIQEDEDVVGAWVELPLLPPPLTLWQLMTGGLWYALLPWGKVRHAVIVTDMRLFYVRHRRPFLPLACLGADLRVDVFRHDHDVIYGSMERTKLSFINRLIHQNIFFENFLPGQIHMQTKFGALQLNRYHGDAVDVYKLLMKLSRNSSDFIKQQDIEKMDVSWDMCQEEVKKGLTKESDAMWTFKPNSDDVVEPIPHIFLMDPAKEQIIFHLTFKDLGSPFQGTYTNTDVIVTSGRIFFWKRSTYKKFDCMSLPCYCFAWRGCLNRFFPGRNLPNKLAFVTLPSILSFSTDLSVDPPSWLVPHHTPLKCPPLEMLCSALTRCVTKDDWAQGGSSGCCPRRAGASSQLQLMWRLKQSSHADEDMLILSTIRPHVLEELSEQDAEDIYNSIGFITDDPDEARIVVREHDRKVEALRKIMSVVQDACNKLNEKMDDLV